MPADPPAPWSAAATSFTAAPSPTGGPAHAGLRLADGLVVELSTDSARARARARATVRGQIDFDVADHLQGVLDRALNASDTGLDIDLAAVTFCDSAGLNMLLRLRRSAHAADRTLAVTAVSSQVERLFAITETTALLTLRPAADDHPHDETPWP